MQCNHHTLLIQTTIEYADYPRRANMPQGDFFSPWLPKATLLDDWLGVVSLQLTDLMQSKQY